MDAIYRHDGILLQDLKQDEVDKINKLIDEFKANNKNSGNILPRPLVYDRASYNREYNGKKFNFYSPNAFQLRLMKEIIAMTMVLNWIKDGKKELLNDAADLLVNVITLCITELDVLGYDENNRSKLFEKANIRNKRHGYFDKCENEN